MTSWTKFLERKDAIQHALGYEFREHELLLQALTHRSFSHESRKHQQAQSYERLEFLGDAVLELIISHHLWQRYPDLPEGELTRLRAALVKGKTLAGVARRLAIGPVIRLGRGEKIRKEHNRASLLADVVEAILGAVFLDGGLNAARTVCFKLMDKELRELDPKKVRNYRSLLQESASQRALPEPSFRLLKMEGPEHEAIFHMEGWLTQEYRATGQGRSKKEATQDTARNLYFILNPDETESTPPSSPSETNETNTTDEPQHPPQGSKT